jgi:hypothetical protein
MKRMPSGGKPNHEIIDKAFQKNPGDGVEWIPPQSSNHFMITLDL